MKKAINPCYKCSDRKLYCHADCEKYAEFKAELHEIKKAIKNDMAKASVHFKPALWNIKNKKRNKN